jgi:hypothetical protein
MVEGQQGPAAPPMQPTPSRLATRSPIHHGAGAHPRPRTDSERPGSSPRRVKANMQRGGGEPEAHAGASQSQHAARRWRVPCSEIFCRSPTCCLHQNLEVSVGTRNLRDWPVKESVGCELIIAGLDVYRDRLFMGDVSRLHFGRH